MDMPVESRFKYGRFDDDMDELITELGGEPAPRSPKHNATGTEREEGEGVDEDIFSEIARNTRDKYGR